jgi:hypothetical protein
LRSSEQLKFMVQTRPPLLDRESRVMFWKTVIGDTDSECIVSGSCASDSTMPSSGSSAAQAQQRKSPAPAQDAHPARFELLVAAPLR